jgi:hypothetical protein
MILKFYKSNGKYLVGVLLLTTAMNLFPSSLAQKSGDIIRIGSPSEWQQYEAYWKQLIKNSKRRPSGEASGEIGNGDRPPTAETDSKELQQALVKNLRVSDLQLLPILKLNGSSQVMGKIKNGNSKAITVFSVNLEVLDASGNLVQTSAPSPEPSTIPPGETVTFQQQLNTIPFEGGFQVRLSRNNPFTILGDRGS